MDTSPIFAKDMLVSARHLHIPVKNGSPKVKFDIHVDGQIVRAFDVELALEEPVDWWAFYDISAFHGQTITLIAVEGDVSVQAASWLAEAITQSDDIREASDLYHEKYRPQFHFTSRRGWNNDPNGMVYANGLWHLFYQYNPFGITWGNMHWGYATSPDLVHWQEQPVALYQRSLQDMAFSGSAVLDHHNTTGFGSAQQPPLVLAFTSTGRGECLAYSLDDGKTFCEYEDNPVIAHQGRDPKIIWYEPDQKWVMIVYEEIGEERGYAMYDSRDMKSWNRLQFLPDYFECPELFELPIEGEPGKKAWVLYGCLWEKARSACAFGLFDGQQFTPQETNPVSHYGPHFYAAQIFNDAPNQRRIMVGWLAAWGQQYPGMPFNQGMSVPLELSLRRTAEGLRLCFNPVKELETLRLGTITIYGLSAMSANAFLADAAARSELLDFTIRLYAEGGKPFSLDVRGYPISVDPQAGKVTFAGSEAAIPAGLHEVELRVLVDRAVTEVFVNQGVAAFCAMTIPVDGSPTIHLAGTPRVVFLEMSGLRSIWE